MRTRGAGARIPAEYRDVTSPFVGVHVIYRPNDHYHELLAYAHYLAKDGKDDREDASVHFTRDGQEPDIPAFLSRLGYTWKTVAYVPALTRLATGVISGCLSWPMALGLTYLKGMYLNEAWS